SGNRWAGKSRGVAPNSVAHARRKRILQSLWDTGDLPLPRRASLRLQRKWPRISGELSPRGIGHRHVRWKLQLARSDMDAGERPADPRAPVVLFVLRRQLQNRVSDRFGQVNEPVRGGPRNRQSANRDFSARWVWPAAGVRRYGEISNRSPMERLHPVLRIFSRRQWRGPWSQPSDRL